MAAEDKDFEVIPEAVEKVEEVIGTIVEVEEVIGTIVEDVEAIHSPPTATQVNNSEISKKHLLCTELQNPISRQIKREFV